jgi:1,4-alpha-glucan branching enzyme
MVIKRGKSDVTFVYAPGGEVQKVAVVGSFNGWDPEQGSMRRQKDGTFRRKEELGPGHHEYKYLVDGQWLPDPEGDRRVHNSYGTENSIVSIG